MEIGRGEEALPTVTRLGKRAVMFLLHGKKSNGT
jgi:hypothetical protein